MTRPDQTRPDQTSNYDFLYDKEYYSKSIHINHFADKKLNFRIINDCYVLPFNIAFNEGGLFGSDGVYVNGSSFRDGRFLQTEQDTNEGVNISTLIEEQRLNISDAVHEHKTVVYLGLFLSTWGHFITDSMRLLWFIKSDDFREKFSDCELIYIHEKEFKPEGSYKRMFEILGINVSMMRAVEKLTKYDSIIIPDECFFKSHEGLRFFTSEYISAIDGIRNFAVENLRLSSSEAYKVYYSYSGYVSGKSIGEDKLERYFLSKGYEIIHPERLSLDEQLNVLINCRSFASTIGSCSHNMLFLRDDTEVILIPRANYLTSYQLVVDQVHRQNIHYIDSSFSIFTHKRPWHGPYLYFISSNLRKYFHDADTSDIIDLSDFDKYMNANHCADNPEAYRYYSMIAANYFSQLFALRKSKALKERLKRIPLLRKAVRALKKILHFIL